LELNEVYVKSVIQDRFWTL